MFWTFSHQRIKCEIPLKNGYHRRAENQILILCQDKHLGPLRGRKTSTSLPPGWAMSGPWLNKILLKWPYTQMSQGREAVEKAKMTVWKHKGNQKGSGGIKCTRNIVNIVSRTRNIILQWARNNKHCEGGRVNLEHLTQGKGSYYPSRRPAIIQLQGQKYVALQPCLSHRVSFH